MTKLDRMIAEICPDGVEYKMLGEVDYHIFGFTGTPIFAVNAGSGGCALLRTTPQAFGDKLHT